MEHVWAEDDIKWDGLQGGCHLCEICLGSFYNFNSPCSGRPGFFEDGEFNDAATIERFVARTGRYPNGAIPNEGFVITRLY